jgi:outer membrane protein assembly factor BamB
MHRLNNPASSTPAVDSQGVYLLVYEPGHLKLFAWNHQGEPLWERDLGQWVAQHGFGASPLVVNDKVIVLNSQEPWEGLPEPAKSQLLAFETASGQALWNCDLIESKACYATPLVWQDEKGKSWLVCTTQGDGILVVDPENGQRAWNQTVFKQRTVGSPILQGNRLIANNGSGGGGNYVVSVDLASANHPTLWEVRQGAGYVPSVLEVAGKVYLFADNGIVTCVDGETGREQWKQRVSDGFWASPVTDGTRLFCPDKNGNLKILNSGSSYELLGSIPLGAPSQATPALAGGRLIVRTENKLWCFGKGNSP